MSTHDDAQRIAELEKTVEELREIIRQADLSFEAAAADRDKLLTVFGGVTRSAERGSKMHRILMRAIERTQKQYANVVLHVYTQPSQIAEWAKNAEPDVVHLVRNNLQYPRGKCENCGAISPLFSDTLECSWGCTVTAEEDRKAVMELNRQATEDNAVAEAFEKRLKAAGRSTKVGVPDDLFDMISKAFEDDL